jgi:hypothetical protein
MNHKKANLSKAAGSEYFPLFSEYLVYNEYKEYFNSNNHCFQYPLSANPDIPFQYHARSLTQQGPITCFFSNQTIHNFIHTKT